MTMFFTLLRAKVEFHTFCCQDKYIFTYCGA